MTIESGTSSNNTLYGGINSSKTLMGYGGDDTYVLYKSKDKIVETADGGSNDTIQLDPTYSANYASYNYAYTKYYNWDSFGIKGYSYTLNSSDIEVLDGSQITSNIRLISNLKTATTIKGGSGNDYIVGGKASDIITGENGDDILYGGVDSVSDTLQGGSGCDVYVIRDRNDVINDTDDNVFGNRLVLDKSFSGNGIDLNSQYTYATTGIRDLNAFYVKKSLTLRGSADEYTDIESGSGSDTIYGGSKGGILFGNAGNDLIFGGAQDYFLEDLEGGNGNDTLVGAEHASAYEDMHGGYGNDTYVVYSTLGIIGEYANGGIDTINLNKNSSISSLSLSFYNSSVDNYYYIENIDGSAITSNNLALSGNSLVNKITGGRGADTLSGGNDLTADTLTGGDGNDTYLVYSSKDKVVEGANTVSDANTGSDTVALQSTYNLKAYTMANNVETLNATSISKAMTLTGNASSNTIKGTSYADKISGGAGNDILYGNAGNDTLTGGVGDDTFGFAAGDAKDVITSTDKGDRINIQATNVSTSDMLFYSDKKGALYIDYTADSITGTKLGVGADVISVAKGKWDPSTMVQVGNKEVLIGSIIQAINTSGSGLSNLDATAISALTTSNQTDITLTWNAV